MKHINKEDSLHMPPPPPDRGAPLCDDELPLFSTVGRGIKGDSFRVEVRKPDTCTETYLEGLSYDEATKEWKTEWVSENINGGELSYQYNLRPYTIPRTFTITFIYRRPGRKHDGIVVPDGQEACGNPDDCCWSWTTPAIPYIWSIDDNGAVEGAENIVGSGVADLFVRASKTELWSWEKHERLHYPKGTTHADYNAPFAEEPWSATITFGHDGDVKLPNFPDLDEIFGVEPGTTEKWAEDQNGNVDGDSYNNFKDYSDAMDQKVKDDVLDHVHKDLGFNDPDHKTGTGNAAWGGKDSVKAYIDWSIEQAVAQITNKYDTHLKNIYGLLDDIIDHIYGASKTEVASGSATNSDLPQTNKGWKINWNPNQKIPQGNLNVYSGDTAGKWIKTHDDSENDDLWAK